ncbi:putative polyadenylate-binding protein-interacting protein [Sesbania bispinosa]|nr:putative polyadenylate-binding protein-interacting protein [Sesbania bispinosa]
MGSPGDLTEASASSKPNGETRSVNSRGTSPRSDSVGAVAASFGPGLSPSSSVGSLSSEKSTLNPYAKVRKFKIDFLKNEYFTV